MPDLLGFRFPGEPAALPEFHWFEPEALPQSHWFEPSALPRLNSFKRAAVPRLSMARSRCGKERLRFFDAHALGTLAAGTRLDCIA